MPEFEFAGTISHGTLRTEDLIPAFENALEQIDAKLFAEVSANRKCSCGYFEEHKEPCEECEAYYLGELEYALQVCAPQGYYFGAHWGDPSDFGFWEDCGC